MLVYLTLQLQQVEKEHKAELAKMVASHKATIQRAHLHPYRGEGKGVPPSSWKLNICFAQYLITYLIIIPLFLGAGVKLGWYEPGSCGASG